MSLAAAPVMSTQVKTGASRRYELVLGRQAATSQAGAKWLPGVDARHARQLPCRLRDAVVSIDPRRVDDAEEEEQERDQNQRHLRDALARLTLPDGVIQRDFAVASRRDRDRARVQRRRGEVGDDERDGVRTLRLIDVARRSCRSDDEPAPASPQLHDQVVSGTNFARRLVGDREAVPPLLARVGFVEVRGRQREAGRCRRGVGPRAVASVPA